MRKYDIIFFEFNLRGVYGGGGYPAPLRPLIFTIQIMDRKHEEYVQNLFWSDALLIAINVIKSLIEFFWDILFTELRGMRVSK